MECSSSGLQMSSFAQDPKLPKEQRMGRHEDSFPINSTSSSKITGFVTPTVFSAFNILPGIDPMYVRLKITNHSQESKDLT